MSESKVGLNRVLGAWAITVYAVGDILGAGIYALVGKVVAVAGPSAWLSFVVSAVIALLTGLTYAELSSRYPLAGGASAYCRRAYRHPAVAFLIGVLVLTSGITSAAAVSHAFIGYLAEVVAVPQEWLLGSIGLLVLMTALNYRGIEESARVNFVLTSVELGGLLLVLTAGFLYASGQPSAELAARVTPELNFGEILAGTTIAFYAYIGFEDTTNVAEEVKDASRVLPRAILTAIGVSCVLYGGVTLAALLTVPAEILAASGAPLLEVLKVSGVELPGPTFSIIALFAICNTGLLNLIMASRLMYGMASEGLLPAALAQVHAERKTPWVAVLVAFVLAAMLAASGGVKVLAQTTSLLLLVVFTVLHIGLIRLKWNEEPAAPEVFIAPRWTPVAGAIVCAVMACQYPFEVYVRMLVVVAAGAGLYWGLARPR